MEIAQREVRGVTILDLTGRFVLEDGVTLFTDRVTSLVRARHTQILLNFDGVTYLDSAAVGAVAWQYITALKRDVLVKLLNLRPRSHRVLNDTRLLSVLEHFESEDDAITSFTSNTDGEVNPIFT